MTEGYINIAQVESDEELETAAVAGAAAVKRLIADRNNLRNQLAASRAAQEELRQRLATLHQRYIELAKKIVAQLHQFDSTMRDAVRERTEATHGEATSMPAPMNQFAKSGLPVGQQSPSPSSNGVSHGNGALPPQPWDLDGGASDCLARPSTAPRGFPRPTIVAYQPSERDGFCGVVPMLPCVAVAFRFAWGLTAVHSATPVRHRCCRHDSPSL